MCRCSNDRSLYYHVHFDFHKCRFYRDWSLLSPSAILSFMEKTFLLRLSRAMDRHIREMQKMSYVFSAVIVTRVYIVYVQISGTDLCLVSLTC